MMQWLMVPAWKVRDRGFEPRYGIMVSKKQTFFPRSLEKIQFYGEPPWPRGCVLDHRPTGLKFRAISSFSGGYPGSVWPSIMNYGGPRLHSFIFNTQTSYIFETCSSFHLKLCEVILFQIIISIPYIKT